MKGLLNLAIFAFLGSGGYFVWSATRAPKTTIYMHVVEPEPVLFADFWFTAWRITATVFFAALCAVLLAGAWWALSKARNADRYIAHEGGLMPGIRMNTSTLWERLRGINQITVINPNNVGTTDATVRIERNAVHVMGGRSDWTAAEQLRVSDGVKRIQGEAARASAFSGVGRGGSKAPSQAELLEKAGYFEQRTEAERLKVEAQRQKLLGDAPEAEEPHAEPLPPVDWRGALMQSTVDRFIIGQNEDTGELATFEPRKQIHCGVIGATGTGKTASTGALMALEALRTGYRTIILDPKGGADWQIFDRHAEWHPTDRTVICDQIAVILKEHERRHAMTGRSVPNVMALPNPPQPIMVFVEEYGDLCSELSGVSRSQYAHLERMLDRIMRLARMTDIHCVFLDQYPEHWSQQLITNCKLKVVYRLGENQGAKLKIYDADQLPDQGVFSIRGTRYSAWHVLPDAPPTLRRLPMAKDVPLLPAFAPRANEIGGEGSDDLKADPPPPDSFAKGAPTRENSANDGANVSDWREWSFAWLDQNSFARQADLAAAMGEANGKGKEAMRSTAHKFYHEWKATKQ